MANMFEKLLGARMDTAKAIEIVGALAKGINPRTGEEFSKRSPYRNTRTIRALLMAAKSLEHMESGEQRFSKAGAIWEEKEEQKLVSAFDAGRTVKQIARTHQRTEGAIRSRLEKLGKLRFIPVVERAGVKNFQL